MPTSQLWCHPLTLAISPGCGSHLRLVHYSTCLLCLFLSPIRGTTAWPGWEDHMKTVNIATSHGMGAREELQAKLVLAALTTPDVDHFGCDCHPTGTRCIDGNLPLLHRIPTPTPRAFCKLYSSPPSAQNLWRKNLQWRILLVYKEDVNPSSSDLSPETEQSLLDPPPGGGNRKSPRHLLLLKRISKRAAMSSPSDLRQYDYAINRQSGIMDPISKGTRSL